MRPPTGKDAQGSAIVSGAYLGVLADAPGERRVDAVQELPASGTQTLTREHSTAATTRQGVRYADLPQRGSTPRGWHTPHRLY